MGQICLNYGDNCRENKDGKREWTGQVIGKIEPACRTPQPGSQTAWTPLFMSTRTDIDAGRSSPATGHSGDGEVLAA